MIEGVILDWLARGQGLTDAQIATVKAALAPFEQMLAMEPKAKPHIDTLVALWPKASPAIDTLIGLLPKAKPEIDALMALYPQAAALLPKIVPAALIIIAVAKRDTA